MKKLLLLLFTTLALFFSGLSFALFEPGAGNATDPYKWVTVQNNTDLVKATTAETDQYKLEYRKY